ncbi:hypothetical protein EWM64_g14 [Hericium alpestre]|uniref:Enoyl reductase (ER) domain-containing protein n=1 Tax=Hericium alpestre TaxID=135208 RepID=A0A4Z0AC64_9AGAM|nr:hypothetical protein EWM64_g14 [Hericium alpestre]
MSSASQKALLIPSKGANFEIGTRAIPKPGHGQVLVKVHAAALNPVDKYIQKAGVFVDEFPAVAGNDGAGTIEELGEGVTGVQKGDRVLLQGLWVPDRGTFQQYVLGDAVRVAKIPSKYSFDEAATVPLTFATAAIGLYGKKGAARGGAGLARPWTASGRDKYKGNAALIVGGSSSVGRYAIQLAKLSGFGPIITTASSRNAEYAKSAGATHVIDYHTTSYADLPAAVAKIAPSVPLVYDAIASPEAQEASWKILAPKGSLITTLEPSVGKLGEEAEDGKTVHFVFGSSNSPENYYISNDFYDHLTSLLDTGAIKPNRFEKLPGGLAAIPAGVERLGQGKVSGVKLVANPQEGL